MKLKIFPLLKESFQNFALLLTQKWFWGYALTFLLFCAPMCLVVRYLADESCNLNASSRFLSMITSALPLLIYLGFSMVKITDFLNGTYDPNFSLSPPKTLIKKTFLCLTCNFILYILLIFPLIRSFTLGEQLPKDGVGFVIFLACLSFGSLIFIILSYIPPLLMSVTVSEKGDIPEYFKRSFVLFNLHKFKILFANFLQGIIFKLVGLSILLLIGITVIAVFSLFSMIMPNFHPVNLKEIFSSTERLLTPLFITIFLFGYYFFYFLSSALSRSLFTVLYRRLSHEYDSKPKINLPHRPTE